MENKNCEKCEIADLIIKLKNENADLRSQVKDLHHINLLNCNKNLELIANNKHLKSEHTICNTMLGEMQEKYRVAQETIRDNEQVILKLNDRLQESVTPHLFTEEEKNAVKLTPTIIHEQPAENMFGQLVRRDAEVFTIPCVPKAEFSTMEDYAAELEQKYKELEERYEFIANKFRCCLQQLADEKKVTNKLKQMNKELEEIILDHEVPDFCSDMMDSFGDCIKQNNQLKEDNDKKEDIIIDLAKRIHELESEKEKKDQSLNEVIQEARDTEEEHDIYKYRQQGFNYLDKFVSNCKCSESELHFYGCSCGYDDSHVYVGPGIPIKPFIEPNSLQSEKMWEQMKQQAKLQAEYNKH